MTDYVSLPDDLPEPVDDGACDHLTGLAVPSVPLQATDGSMVNLSKIAGTVVVFIYPMIGKPGVPLPERWNETPGARGCTPQSCSMRERFGEFKARSITLFGLSLQASGDQREAKTRLHLPYELLSDSRCLFQNELKLPTFTMDGINYLKRVTLIVRDQTITRVFYPVFPPDRNADEVLDYLRTS